MARCVKVFIERVERYSRVVEVDADSKAEAERKVRELDKRNELENEWHEFQPTNVETTYEAEED